MSRISERSAMAYKEAATNEYKKVFDLPVADSVKSAIFDGTVSEVEDTIASISDAVKAGEMVAGFFVPHIEGYPPAHYLFISDENVVQLFVN